MAIGQLGATGQNVRQSVISGNSDVPVTAPSHLHNIAENHAKDWQRKSAAASL